MEQFEHLEETQLSSEAKYDGTLLHIRRDTVRLPDGKTATREYNIHNGAVCIIPLLENGEVLLERQYRYPLREVITEIPAGKLDDPDEEGIVCASRELKEETGYSSDDLEWLLTIRTTVAFCDERIEVFVARNLIPGEQHLDEDEFVDVKAYKLEELKEMIFEGKIQDSKTMAAILAYESKYLHGQNA